MATYEITVSTDVNGYPTVTAIRHLGAVRGLLGRLGRWIRGYGRKTGRTPGERGNADIVNLHTVDIAMDVPCECLRREILAKLAGTTSDPEKVRLVFCLPAGRRAAPAKAVDV